jgi:hypothetical protein
VGAAVDVEGAARVLEEVAESFLNYRVVATREAEQRAELAAQADLVASVPALSDDVHDFAGLVTMGEEFWR